MSDCRQCGEYQNLLKQLLRQIEAAVNPNRATAAEIKAFSRRLDKKEKEGR